MLKSDIKSSLSRQTPCFQARCATEIDNLLNNHITEPSSSRWRAQVLIVDDGHHKKRLVIVANR